MSPIQTHNDGKGKPQSWQAWVENFSADFDDPSPSVGGWGATEEEAVADLRNQIKKYIEQLQALLAVEPTQVK